MNFIPPPLLTDSYKTTHFLQYPQNINKLVCYAEFRKGFSKDDSRIIFYGIDYILSRYISRRWTLADVENAALLFQYHHAGYSPFPFPRALFEKFIRENDGYFPVTIRALAEGSVVHPHTPVVTITAMNEYAPLATYLETLICHLWYPSTVATLSRRIKDTIAKYFEESVDVESFTLLNSRLHDFGFRGCTCVEQSVIGGSAHLLSFDGSDTLSACWYAQERGGEPIGTSIPATEHSVMTAHINETEAIQRMIECFGKGVFAVVMDSYDYANALENVLPSVVENWKLESGRGFIVLRPDSGKPVDVAMQALEAAEKVFGCLINKKGYKVINGAGVIQGDGVDHSVIEEILQKVISCGYAAQNVAFGMGGALLQKLNRDMLSFATKLCYMEQNGNGRSVMKMPKTDVGKMSLPGPFHVVKEGKVSESGKDALEVVWDCGPFNDYNRASFKEIRQRLEVEWNSNEKVFDPISKELRLKMEKLRNEK